MLREGTDTEARPAKSSRVAFLLSLAIPGLGELYTGATLRGVGFMASEALTWLAYTQWRAKGNDLKADFRTYAEEHWDEAGYIAWQVYNASLGSPFTETETLPRLEDDAQQRYEMIGKYAQFVFGWDDVAAEYSTDLAVMRALSSRRLDYEGQRNESNKHLKRASVVVGLAVLNRIASAIHASWHARSLEQNGTPHSIWVGLKPLDAHGRPAPQATVNLRF